MCLQAGTMIMALHETKMRKLDICGDGRAEGRRLGEEAWLFGYRQPSDPQGWVVADAPNGAEAPTGEGDMRDRLSGFARSASPVLAVGVLGRAAGQGGWRSRVCMEEGLMDEDEGSGEEIDRLDVSDDVM